MLSDVPRSTSTGRSVVRRLVRALPAFVRRLQGRRAGAAGDRGARLRRRVPPADPSDRGERPQGAEQHAAGRGRDPGSPWAIGADGGGHDAVHPELGTLADFDRLVARANELDLEIAIDFAIQCSPDHPWLKEHPEWFQRRPDGTIKYAENPPKKYQDIVNVDWECEDWFGLWQALLDVVLHWVSHGVRIFRVDNPHTKPLRVLGVADRARCARDDPDVIFLAEAFTRPAMMHELAKSASTSRYTYFTWRNTKRELTEY